MPNEKTVVLAMALDAIAVGGVKGGVGKSTYVLELIRRGLPKRVVDGDVANPTVAKALRLKGQKVEDVYIYRPELPEHCAGCGLCAKQCREQALIRFNEGLALIRESCNGCGVCWHLCPSRAISPKPEKIGEIWKAVMGEVEIVYAKSLATSVEITHIARALRKYISEGTIVDLPAGMHCDVLALLEPCERLRVIAEPSPMGFHDFKLAVDLGKKMRKKIEVVINKVGLGLEKEIENFCSKEHLPIVERIPFSLDKWREYAHWCD